MLGGDLGLDLLRCLLARLLGVEDQAVGDVVLVDVRPANVGAAVVLIS